MLTGNTNGHLCTVAEASVCGVRLHRDVVAPFLRLKEEARKAGFDLQILSGFRSFEEQLSIWNRKASGQLAVLDSAAVPLDIQSLSKRELVFAILRWSALPGASRHHWGTDLDIYDGSARPEGYEIELVPEEVDAGGMFGPLHEWLDERIAAAGAFSFFRPYDQDRQGVAPERWHLSYAPIASGLQEQLTTDLLRGAIETAALELRDLVLQDFEEIYHRFVTNTNRSPA